MVFFIKRAVRNPASYLSILKIPIIGECAIFCRNEPSLPLHKYYQKLKYPQIISSSGNNALIYERFWKLSIGGEEEKEGARIKAQGPRPMDKG